MRLLRCDSQNELKPTKDLVDQIPPYAILSHTWSENDEDEVTLTDFQNDRDRTKPGWEKIEFCRQLAKQDGLEHFWVDTCCIDKTNSVELAEAITSMFRWYHEAAICYVFLSDVSNVSWSSGDEAKKINLRNSRWFRRGWTLQELLAPKTVHFLSKEAQYIGDKHSLAYLINEITGIPIDALRRTTPISQFTVDERLRWAEKRQTRKIEDRAYCLMGIFNVFIPLMYGERENAFDRLQDEILRRHGKRQRYDSTGQNDSETMSFQVGNDEPDIQNSTLRPALPTKATLKTVSQSSHATKHTHNLSSPSSLSSNKWHCGQCKRAFTTKKGYNNHVQLHGKHFYCDLPDCPRDRCSGFTVEQDLHRHQRSVHGLISKGDKVWICPAVHCTAKRKYWPRWDNIKQHVCRVHSDDWLGGKDEAIEKAQASFFYYDPAMHSNVQRV